MRVTTRVIITSGCSIAPPAGMPSKTAPTPPMIAHQQQIAIAATIRTISKVRF